MTNPKISVITPALNCGPFAARCIESVLGQEYPNFEHIVMDGGSTDGTVDVLRRYPHLDWKSEPDKGEANALNKALRRASGDVVTWLNADDYLAPGAFARVAAAYTDSTSFHLLYGNADRVDEDGRLVGRYICAPDLTFPILLRWWLNPIFPNQRAMYFRRSTMLETGEFSETLHYSIDYEYWIRVIKNHPIRHIDAVLGNARERLVCKSRDTEPQQIQSHWSVVLSFLRFLSDSDRMEFWRDFCVFSMQNPWPANDPPALGGDDLRHLKTAFSEIEMLMRGQRAAQASAAPARPPTLFSVPAPSPAPMAAAAVAPSVAPWSAPAGKLKIAAHYDHGQRLVEVNTASAMAVELRKLFQAVRPRKVVETGTYEGCGTTKIIASALAELGDAGTRFYSIECNPRNVGVATRNLMAAGLLGRVQILTGLSVPRRLLPTPADIQNRLVVNAPAADLFIDHEENERAALYFGETDFPEVADDLLGFCLNEFDGRPDVLMLDSGGHMGHVEFNYVIDRLRGMCVIALDDIYHVKHHRSFEQIQRDPRFHILASSREKFGFCLAAFTPQGQASQ